MNLKLPNLVGFLLLITQHDIKLTCSSRSNTLKMTQERYKCPCLLIILLKTSENWSLSWTEREQITCKITWGTHLISLIYAAIKYQICGTWAKILWFLVYPLIHPELMFSWQEWSRGICWCTVSCCCGSPAQPACCASQHYRLEQKTPLLKYEVRLVCL